MATLLNFKTIAHNYIITLHRKSTPHIIVSWDDKRYSTGKEMVRIFDIVKKIINYCTLFTIQIFRFVHKLLSQKILLKKYQLTNNPGKCWIFSGF